MPNLILASTSPYRRALLERLRLPFRCLTPACDEETLRAPSWTPRELAERRAAAKALSLAQAEQDATIVGSDQTVSFEGRAFGKPGTPLATVQQLTMLSGRRHELITALAVWHRGRLHEHTDVAHLLMRPLTPEQIARYVAADQPYDCAGGYKLESLGVCLFDEIVAADHTAITGLPLLALTRILAELGYAIP